MPNQLCSYSVDIMNKYIMVLKCIWYYSMYIRTYVGVTSQGVVNIEI